MAMTTRQSETALQHKGSSQKQHCTAMDDALDLISNTV